MLAIRRYPNGVIFKIFVQPRSAKSVICGLHGDALKVKVTAPPVAGAANKMCIKSLAKSLGVPQSLLEIITGANSRTKQVLLRCEQPPMSEKEFNHLKHRIETLPGSRKSRIK